MTKKFSTRQGLCESGTTATLSSKDSYEAVIDWDCRQFERKTVLVANTDGVNSLTYRIVGLAYEQGLAFEVVPPTIVLAGGVLANHLDHFYARLRVEVMSTVAGSAALFQIDYGGQSPTLLGIEPLEEFVVSRPTIAPKRVGLPEKEHGPLSESLSASPVIERAELEAPPGT